MIKNSFCPNTVPSVGMPEQFVGPCSWQIYLCWNTHLIALKSFNQFVPRYLTEFHNSGMDTLELIGGHSLDIHGVCCVWPGFGGCEEFLGGFCFCKDSTTACGAVWFRACWKPEKVPVDCVGFGSQPNSTYCRFHVFFLRWLLLDICSGLLPINSQQGNILFSQNC